MSIHPPLHFSDASTAAVHHSQVSLYLNFFLHSFNSLSCLVDILINRRPIKLLHFYLPLIYGAAYAVFSVAYWLSGGLGHCQRPEDDFSAAGLRTSLREKQLVNGPGYDCEKFTTLYPILDWEGRPEKALVTVVISFVLLFTIHCFWFGVFKIRRRLYSCTTRRSPFEVRKYTYYRVGQR